MPQLTLTPAEFHALSDSERKAKYGNKKVVTDDGRFDSQREYGHWLGLQQDQRDGKIRNLQRQVPYQLEVNGVKVCKYVADFVYEEPFEIEQRAQKARDYFGLGKPVRIVVADSKGFKTEGYRLKKKLMLACLGIEVKEL